MEERHSLKTAKNKAAKYCAYQERTQQQVRGKLYDWGFYGDDVEEVIAFLISEGFISEERYAIAYVRGHFKQKKWGRLKIKIGLQQKDISTYCINKGFKEIKETEYLNTIEELLQKKYIQLSDTDPYVKKNKAVRYVLQKGFEPELVWDIAKSLF